LVSTVTEVKLPIPGALLIYSQPNSGLIFDEDRQPIWHDCVGWHWTVFDKPHARWGIAFKVTPQARIPKSQHYFSWEVSPTRKAVCLAIAKLIIEYY
jgi:hypothetical protein